VKTETFSERQKRRRRLVCWSIAILALAVAAAKFAFFPNNPDPPVDARVLQARQDMRGLAGALGIYLIDHGRYATEQEGLALLVREGLLPQTPKDPWSNPYEYSAIGSGPRNYRIRSLGADGREGGVGVNADIVLETGENPRYLVTDGTGTSKFWQQYDIR
jgi:general secretion pathway protein G